MATTGILLLGGDGTIQAQAKKYKTPVTVGDRGTPLPYEKTLVVEAGTRVPWGEAIDRAWALLDRWDAAVPLWRYNVLAADVGTADERKRTEAVVRDLRVPLHSVELLFLRKNADGELLWSIFSAECGENGEKRLAFLRALYQVKPRLRYLTTTWLVDVQQTARQDAGKGQRRTQSKKDLVRVEVEPGVFSQCYRGQEAEAIALHQASRSGRRRRR